MANVAAVLPEGARFGFSTSGAGSYTYVEGIQIIPATSNSAEAKDKTTVNDTRKVYGAGLKDSPDMTIEGIYLSEDSDQQAFLTACRALTELDVVIELPNMGATGKQRTFKFQPLGVNDPEINSSEWVMFQVTGRQNSDSVESDMSA